MACQPCSGQENIDIAEEDWEELVYPPWWSKQWEGVFSTNHVWWIYEKKNR